MPKNQHAWRKFFQKNPTMTYGSPKIRRHFRNKSRSILKLEKNVFHKKWSPKLIFLNEFFFWKNSVDLWHRKLTLKVQFRHFLRNHNSLQDCLKQFPSSMLILGQNSCILGPTIFKIPQPNWHLDNFNCMDKVSFKSVALQ